MFDRFLPSLKMASLAAYILGTGSETSGSLHVDALLCLHLHLGAIELIRRRNHFEIKVSSDLPTH